MGLNNVTSAKELIGFNNTGNICLWPSEEVLSYLMVQNKSEYCGKRICELGAGMTGLAGLLLSLNQSESSVTVTDGNQTSVTNIASIIDRNYVTADNCNVDARTLVWSENSEGYADLKNQFDLVICADCTFFTELHKALLETIKFILKPEGEVIILSPQRSGTLNQFIPKAEEIFTVKVRENYNDSIWERHTNALNNPLYDPDIHYPLFISMKLL